MMGSGKTQAMYAEIRNNPDKSYMVVTPYLKTIQDAKNENLNIYEPEYKGGTKMDSLKYLLSHGYNICCTHSLFLDVDNEIWDLIHDGGYTLFIDEALDVRERREGNKLDRERETSALLELVGLPAHVATRFPHELSGGQLQRVCIARAVACNPEIILFDEAISSLDAHTQVQVMDLLRELKEKLGLTYIFITHDLTSITYLCDDVLFLYQGHVTEYMPVSRISQTRDEYARRLLESIVVFDADEEVAV